MPLRRGGAMTPRRAAIGLAASFALWLALEAAGVGMAYTFYLAFCLVWIFGPWLLSTGKAK